MQSQTSQIAVESFLLLKSPVKSVLCVVSLNVFLTMRWPRKRRTDFTCVMSLLTWLMHVDRSKLVRTLQLEST